ncbi:hypothetical protein RRG08_004785 [Elysia crispata]|uniref:DJ-1/PfpI domain-containing protein n=1 Tax=Elysia crispata TaxID=231223 RepID=A0AAE1DZY1_9GAST|nr:hypothetical protein RRG08_004785 [Elysia crispata]
MYFRRLFLCITAFCIHFGNIQTDSVQSSASLTKDGTPKKILVVLTSTDTIGDTGLRTGWFLQELAHPYKAFRDAGFEMESVSPKGDKAPVDPLSVELCEQDSVCQWFQKDADAQYLVQNTKTASQINPGDYAAVFYPGGHGPMFDLATDSNIAKITLQIFEDGGVVGAHAFSPEPLAWSTPRTPIKRHCHNTLLHVFRFMFGFELYKILLQGLIPVRLSNGDPIVKGRKVTSFSNAEENAIKRSSVVPFSLEMKLKQSGAIYSAAESFQSHVVVDGRLVTGQNPSSARGVAGSMIRLLR